MRLIDKDALIETLADKLPKWGFKTIDMHVVETLIKNEPTINQWIPVSERLPEYFERVLVSIKTHQVEFVRVDCFDGSDNWTCFGNDVIAWMPLPEPYKVGDNDANV